MSDLQDVRDWADALISAHLGAPWTFGFDSAKRRAGACNYTQQRITVSKYLAARYDDETNRQTLLHEVAHALAGSDAGHGPRWRRIAAGLGYRGSVTHHGETAVELAPWVGVCPSGHTVYRHRRPTRVMSCARCARRFDERFAIRWARREISAATRREAMTPR